MESLILSGQKYESMVIDSDFFRRTGGGGWGEGGSPFKIGYVLAFKNQWMGLFSGHSKKDKKINLLWNEILTFIFVMNVQGRHLSCSGGC